MIYIINGVTKLEILPNSLHGLNQRIHQSSYFPFPSSSVPLIELFDAINIIKSNFFFPYHGYSFKILLFLSFAQPFPYHMLKSDLSNCHLDFLFATLYFSKKNYSHWAIKKLINGNTKFIFCIQTSAIEAATTAAAWVVSESSRREQPNFRRATKMTGYTDKAGI